MALLRRKRIKQTIVCIFISSLSALLMSCQIGYLLGSAYDQTGLLLAREPIQKVLADPNIDSEKKRKLSLTVEAHTYAESIGLKKTKSYTSYVELGRPYVTYVVSAAEKNRLEHYFWSFPLVGKLPYKGYFEKDKAQELAQQMRDKNYDVYVRGVSAYSTLGWFYDPILSSMLNYRDHDLVETLIHELLHATVFIKDATDFNERIANFVGNKGAIDFYKKREGENSETVKAILAERHDDQLFSEFITAEVHNLDIWYKERSQPGAPLLSEGERIERIKSIQIKFIKDIRPKISPGFRKDFETAELNNAKLLLFKLYDNNPAQLEKLYLKYDQTLSKFVNYLKSLQSEGDLKRDLADLK